ncbi:MAG: Alcohol acetyltransferase [Gammaproteobacteria bacterium]|jgi:hypothetical protein|nr:Alcohol acetyltransferase [Gammaproteobacteria bacterium]
MLKNLGFRAAALALTQERYQEDTLVTATTIREDNHICLKDLEVALSKIFLNYEALQQSLQKQDDSSYCFKHNIKEFSLISRKVLQTSDPEYWKTYVEIQLKTPFAFNQPLWEFTLLSNPDGSDTLIFRFHHAIADGISTASLIHQLLQLYITPSYKLEPQKLLIAPEYAYQQERSLEDYENTSALSPSPVTPYAIQAAIMERKTKFHLLAFKLTPLKEFCTQHGGSASGLTINALLTTLFINSMFALKEKSSKAQSISTSTAIDLRQRTTKEKFNKNTFGCFYSDVTCNFNAADLSCKNFVDQIKFVHQVIMTRIQKNSQPPIGAQLKDIRRLSGVESQENLSEFPTNLNLSNLGDTPIKRYYTGNKHSLETLSYFFFVNFVMGFSEIAICCATRDDEIFCNFTHTEPIFSLEEKIQFIKLFLKLIQTHIPNFTLVKAVSDSYDLPLAEHEDLKEEIPQKFCLRC